MSATVQDERSRYIALLEEERETLRAENAEMRRRIKATRRELFGMRITLDALDLRKPMKRGRQ